MLAEGRGVGTVAHAHKSAWEMRVRRQQGILGPCAAHLAACCMLLC